MRKRVFRRLLALMLAVCALHTVAFAETAKVTGSEVNVRSGPGTEYEILGSYTRGSLVEVIGRSNAAWYAVSFQGRTGYMSSRYLELQTDSAYETIVSGSGGGASIALPSQNSVVYSPPAAVYSPPAETYGSSQGGSALLISDWDNVGLIVAPSPVPTAEQTPGIIISTPSPTPDAATPSPLPTVMPSGAVLVTPTPAPSPSPSASPAPLPSPSPSPAPAASETRGGSIAGDYVRFRKGPGTEYSIINTYDRGKPLRILSVSGDWTLCVIDGQTGYVFSRYVQPDASAAQTAPDPAASSGDSQTGGTQSDGSLLVLDNGSAVAPPSGGAQTGGAEPLPTPASTGVSGSGTAGYIKGNNVRFRSGPGLSYSIYTELFYGAAVTITGSSSDWSAIVYNGQAGYVYSQYVVQGSIPTASVGGTASGREIADYALSFVGTPYVWGGKSPSTGFDCSGLVWYVYQHFGYSINRVAADQAKNGRHIEASELQPGDLLCFYSGGSYIGHTGIYIGNNMFVHASSSTTGVITSELTGYYASRGFEARRIL